MRCFGPLSLTFSQYWFSYCHSNSIFWEHLLDLPARQYHYGGREASPAHTGKLQSLLLDTEWLAITKWSSTRGWQMGGKMYRCNLQFVNTLADSNLLCWRWLVPICLCDFKLLLTLPVDSCACERFFSALRRLKTWCRATMTEN
jgi:hypothetical protein